MSVSPSRFAISRTGWIIYGVAEVLLFAIANLTAKNASHPGTVSDIAFATFVAGLVVAVTIGAATLIRQRRATR